MTSEPEHDLSGARRDYVSGKLDRADLDDNPFATFGQWLSIAQQLVEQDMTAMALATASADGKPSLRTVLLKGFDENGFVFYTNYGSRKGADLAENPRGSLLFYWPALERQVEVSGSVEKVSAEESDAYFQSRPRESQLGALASDQSRPVTSRGVLDARYDELEKLYANKDIERPENWGGYRLEPERFEFWQGRVSRLHDRFEYIREGEVWTCRRLNP